MNPTNAVCAMFPRDLSLTSGEPGEEAVDLSSKTQGLGGVMAVIQVHGTGPFVLNYVNPADDPSKANSK